MSMSQKITDMEYTNIAFHTPLKPWAGRPILRQQYKHEAQASVSNAHPTGRETGLPARPRATVAGNPLQVEAKGSWLTQQCREKSRGFYALGRAGDAGDPSYCCGS